MEILSNLSKVIWPASGRAISRIYVLNTYDTYCLYNLAVLLLGFCVCVFVRCHICYLTASLHCLEVGVGIFPFYIQEGTQRTLSSLPRAS